jgi:hypothetical protein
MHQNTVPIVPSTLAATGMFSPAMIDDRDTEMKEMTLSTILLTMKGAQG